MSVLVSASSCVGLAKEMSRVLGHCPGLAGVLICGQLSHLLCKLILMHSPFFQAFLERGQRLWGSLGVLMHPYSPWPLLGLVAALVLCCVLLLSRNYEGVNKFPRLMVKSQVLFGHLLGSGNRQCFWEAQEHFSAHGEVVVVEMHHHSPPRDWSQLLWASTIPYLNSNLKSLSEELKFLIQVGMRRRWIN